MVKTEKDIIKLRCIYCNKKIKKGYIHTLQGESHINCYNSHHGN